MRQKWIRGGNFRACEMPRRMTPAACLQRQIDHSSCDSRYWTWPWNTIYKADTGPACSLFCFARWYPCWYQPAPLPFYCLRDSMVKTIKKIRGCIFIKSKIFLFLNDKDISLLNDLQSLHIWQTYLPEYKKQGWVSF